MSKLDKDQVIEQFTQAYTAANGKSPEIIAKGGWYSVDGGKNVRLATLVEMTAELSGGNVAATKTEKSPTATKKAAPKKAAPKKAAPKKAAPKKAAPKKKPASTAGFSVKAYWEEQVIAKQNASRPPR